MKVSQIANNLFLLHGPDIVKCCLVWNRSIVNLNWLDPGFAGDEECKIIPMHDCYLVTAGSTAFLVSFLHTETGTSMNAKMIAATADDAGPRLVDRE